MRPNRLMEHESVPHEEKTAVEQYPVASSYSSYTVFRFGDHELRNKAWDNEQDKWIKAG